MHIAVYFAKNAKKRHTHRSRQNSLDDGDEIFDCFNWAEEDPGECCQVVRSVRRRRDFRVEKLFQDQKHLRRPVVAVRVVRLDLDVQRLKINTISIISRIG